MGAAVAIGYGAGWWLDGKFGTRPTLSFIGLLLGIAASFMTIVRVARELRRQETEEHEEDEKGD